MASIMIDRIAAVVGEATHNGDVPMTTALKILATMREPTEEMLIAIVDVDPDRSHGDYWRAGIDAALVEEGWPDRHDGRH